MNEDPSSSPPTHEEAWEAVLAWLPYLSTRDLHLLRMWKITREQQTRRGISQRIEEVGNGAVNGLLTH